MREIPIAWDVETHRMKPGMMAPKLVCVSTCDSGEETALYAPGLEVAKDIIKNRRSVAHHAPFDAGIIAAEDPGFLPVIFDAFKTGRLTCTKIREMIIANCKGELKFEFDEATGEFKKQDFSLARPVLRRLNRNIYAKKNGPAARWRLNYHELDGVAVENYPKEAADYAIEDSIHCQKVWCSQQEEIEPEFDLAPGEISQNKAAWALSLLGTWGVRTDAKAVREYKRDLERDFEKQIEICQEFGFRRKGDKPSRDMKKIKGAVEKWYADAGKPMKLTEKGAVATDREQLTDTDHPGLLAVSESTKLEKLLTTYVAALERGTEVPLCPSYNPMVETFRTSCSGGMKIDGVPVGIQLQNQPRGGRVRECIIPRPGNVFAFCDLDTIEMRVLGQVCIELFGQSDIVDAIKDGKDLHIDFAADMLNLSYREAFSRYEAGDTEIENARQQNKISNYGCMGGMGPDSLMSYAKGYGIIISKKQALNLWKGFRRKWSEMPKFFNYVSKLTEDGPALIQFLLTGLWRGGVGYTAACNGFFQHPTAIGAKEALWAAVEECYTDSGSPLFGCRPWLFNHDEIGAEIPYEDFGPKRSHEAAMRLQEIMIAEMKKICPDVPIGATVAMARKWVKGSRPIYVNGVLVPVKPLKKDNRKEWVPDL